MARYHFLIRPLTAQCSLDRTERAIVCAALGDSDEGATTARLPSLSPKMILIERCFKSA